ncbi:MAG TPA: hypothetical protein VNO81_14050 [Candidatus Nitrosotenuis sp.]|nr:hypothetical protein [Candidatus Nitrosotenuis sp.]
MALVGSFLYPVGLHLEPAPLKAVVMVDTSSSFRYLQEALERLKRLAIWLLPGDGVAWWRSTEIHGNSSPALWTTPRCSSRSWVPSATAQPSA